MAKTTKTKQSESTPVVAEKLTNKSLIKKILKKPKEKFLNENQKCYWKMLDDYEITFCLGPSGTGKSFLTLKKALDLLQDENNQYEKIILVRPTVEAGETMGFLPGDILDKIYPYLKPSIDLLYKIAGKEDIEKLRVMSFIEMEALSLMRGSNIDNSILVFEEAQNSTPLQMKLLLTRIGFNSKFFISGDIDQSDKFKDKTKSGLFDAKERLCGVKKIGFFEFGEADIVRNPIIKDILIRYEQ